MVKLNKKFTKTGTEEEVRRIADEAKMDKMSFVLFFVSAKFDFDMISRVINEKYPDIPTIGCISTGEINELGYVDSTITINVIYGDDFIVKPIRLTHLKDKAMVYKRRIRRALSDIGVDYTKKEDKDKYFVISLIDYLSAREESLMTMITNTLNNNYWKLAGGSVGDMALNKSAVSIDGEVFYDTAAFIFIRTDKKVIVRYENIYRKTGKLHRVTSVDMGERKAISADGMPFADLYSKECNVKVSDLDTKIFADKPIGRKIKHGIYIASPIKTNDDKSINFYTRILNGCPFYFMESDDIIKCAYDTAESIKRELKKPELIIGFNCILRYLRMQEENVQKEVYQIINDAAPFCGFTTLGEQIDKMQVNQTLTYIAIGE